MTHFNLPLSFIYTPPPLLATGYPCALVYRRFLFHQSAFVIHLFHTLSGLSLAVFNFGETEKERGTRVCVCLRGWEVRVRVKGLE